MAENAEIAAQCRKADRQNLQQCRSESELQQKCRNAEIGRNAELAEMAAEFDVQEFGISELWQKLAESKVSAARRNAEIALQIAEIAERQTKIANIEMQKKIWKMLCYIHFVHVARFCVFVCFALGGGGADGCGLARTGGGQRRFARRLGRAGCEHGEQGAEQRPRGAEQRPRGAEQRPPGAEQRPGAERNPPGTEQGPRGAEHGPRGAEQGPPRRQAAPPVAPYAVKLSKIFQICSGRRAAACPPRLRFMF